MDRIPTLPRRSFLALGAGALLQPRPARAAGVNPVLVELFTSQGCSSCPPADKFAAELAEDPNLVVLTFNVDYWDYLGWPDTMAKAEYSQRQYDYAKARGDGAVYTPQMVINGQSHVVGSQRDQVEDAVRTARRGDRPFAIPMQISGGEIKASVPAMPVEGQATLWLMAVEARVKQPILRGENAGSEITHTNVVRNLVPAAMWKGQAFEGSWMKKAVMPIGCGECVAVLQFNKVGPVLGLGRAG